MADAILGAISDIIKKQDAATANGIASNLLRGNN